MPHHLSGGERQRVALARALASGPDLLLLDEPFSSIDVELRTSMRREVVDVIRQAAATAILVTHDQDEALSIADRVAVLQHGTIVQFDEPAVLYRRPVNAEVARFIGHANLLFGRLEDGRVRSILGSIAVELDSVPEGAVAVSMLVRPEQVAVRAGLALDAGDDQPRGVVVEPRVPRPRRPPRHPTRPAGLGPRPDRRPAGVGDPRPAPGRGSPRGRSARRATGRRVGNRLAHRPGLSRPNSHCPNEVPQPCIHAGDRTATPS